MIRAAVVAGVRVTGNASGRQGVCWHCVAECHACREIGENSSELRLLLCREKESAEGKKSTNVVTACGIFVSDIMDAAPIDKYFEMFKPGSGRDGGFVRLKMALLSEDEMRTRRESARRSRPCKVKPPLRQVGCRCA